MEEEFRSVLVTGASAQQSPSQHPDEATGIILQSHSRMTSADDRWRAEQKCRPARLLSQSRSVLEEELTEAAILLYCCRPVDCWIEQHIDGGSPNVLLARTERVIAFSYADTIFTGKGMRTIARHLLIATTLFPADTHELSDLPGVGPT